MQKEFDATAMESQSANLLKSTPDFDVVNLMKDGGRTMIIENKEDFRPGDIYQKLGKLDLSLPLDASRSNAPPEFTRLTPDSEKTGWLDKAKGVASDLLGGADTLHDHARMLARAGMTPAERQKVLKEEEALKTYNKTVGGGYSELADIPKTPALDELNRRTTALEKNMAETAKAGMTPLQVAQLESGKASTELQAKYEHQLIALVARYDAQGSVPKDVYAKVVTAAGEQKKVEEAEFAESIRSIRTGRVKDILPPISIFTPKDFEEFGRKKDQKVKPEMFDM